MKKYLVLGILVAALAAAFSVCLNQEPSAAMPSFYGAAKAGKTVWACMQPIGRCYQTTAGPNDTYAFPRTILPGDYHLTDGCQNKGGTYSGSPVRIDFCIPDPPWYNCNCD